MADNMYTCISCRAEQGTNNVWYLFGIYLVLIWYLYFNWQQPTDSEDRRMSLGA